MSFVKHEQIACFHCVQLVSLFVCEQVESVVCSSCGRSAKLEKALDDCFLFLVVSAISTNLKFVESRSYDYMPLQNSRERAWHDRAAMLKSGRALLAA